MGRKGPTRVIADAIDDAWPDSDYWDDDRSGVRLRQVLRPPRLPAVASPAAVADAARLVELEAEVLAIRARLAERMAPGDRIRVGEHEVAFVGARFNAAGDMVAGCGVRVRRVRCLSTS